MHTEPPKGRNWVQFNTIQAASCRRHFATVMRYLVLIHNLGVLSTNPVFVAVNKPSHILPLRYSTLPLNTVRMDCALLPSPYLRDHHRESVLFVDLNIPCFYVLLSSGPFYTHGIAVDAIFSLRSPLTENYTCVVGRFQSNLCATNFAFELAFFNSPLSSKYPPRSFYIYIPCVSPFLRSTRRTRLFALSSYLFFRLPFIFTVFLFACKRAVVNHSDCFFFYKNVKYCIMLWHFLEKERLRTCRHICILQQLRRLWLSENTQQFPHSL